MKDPVKVYDARWEVSEFDNKEVLRLFEATFGYARLIDIDTLVFARDARLGCAQVIEIGIETAVKAGFRVLVCFDPISTPMTYFIAMQTTLTHPKTMGLTITASHNPKQYIGIKFTVTGVEAIGFDCGPLGGLTKVKELYHSTEYILEARSRGSLEVIQNPTEEYIRYTMKLAGVQQGDFKGLKIVLDTFNGSAGPELYRALTLAGADVFPLRLVPNGDFPTGSPNPTSQNKMDQAIHKAVLENADLVIGIDGDGDRMVFGDQKGIFSAGFVMIPILKTIFDQTGHSVRHKILYDPKVNPLALEIWAQLNADPILFRNGHSQIKGHIKEIGALAGAEESGHYYHQFSIDNLQVASENSLFTILLFLRTVNNNKDIIKQVREMQDQIYTSGEFNYQFSDDLKRDHALAAVIELFKSDDALLTNQSEDGIDLEGTVIYKGVVFKKGKVELTNSWYSAYVRCATNEKGVVRSYISSCNPETGEKLREKIVHLLKEKFGGKEIE
jgi:phosphomannomutase